MSVYEGDDLDQVFHPFAGGEGKYIPKGPALYSKPRRIGGYFDTENPVVARIKLDLAVPVIVVATPIRHSLVQEIDGEGEARINEADDGSVFRFLLCFF